MKISDLLFHNYSGFSIHWSIPAILSARCNVLLAVWYVYACIPAREVNKFYFSTVLIALGCALNVALLFLCKLASLYSFIHFFLRFSFLVLEQSIVCNNSGALYGLQSCMTNIIMKNSACYQGTSNFILPTIVQLPPLHGYKLSCVLHGCHMA